MSADNLFYLICESLPKEIEQAEFKNYIDTEVYSKNQRKAIIDALKQFRKINWEAYIANNPDVKQAGINPLDHFLLHGIYEGRPLYINNNFYNSEYNNLPRISIIIMAEHYGKQLERCLSRIEKLDSTEIETIVIVESKRTGLMKAIEASVQESNRYKLLPIDEAASCSGRKAGVAAATGAYIMFLEERDYIDPAEWESILAETYKGFDIASFGSEVDTFSVGRCEYQGSRIIDSIFMTGELNASIYGKIFSRNLACKAYEQIDILGRENFNEMCEYLCLAAKAKNLVSVDRKIIKHDCQGDRAENYNVNEKRVISFISSLEPLMTLCKKLNIEYIFDTVKRKLYTDVIRLILDAPLSSQRQLFKNACSSFGMLYSVKELAKLHYLDGQKIAPLFPLLAAPKPQATLKKKIGIFYYRLKQGGLERTIQNICRVLAPKGYEIFLYLEEKSDHDLETPDSVKKYYLAPSVNTKDYGSAHLSDLYHALIDSKPDIVFYMYMHEPGILWDTLLMRTMGIDVIASLRIDINFELLFRGRPWSFASLLAVARNLNKIFCLNKSTEIFFRSEGVDAQLLPNTIASFKNLNQITRRENIILVSGRLHDLLKKNSEALRVLAEVVKVIPNASMIFIGNFPNKARKDEFYKMAEALGVRSRIHITGWMSNPASLFTRAKALFSASLLEGFPNAIAEAQKAGLPVVMYDLDVIIAEDNEGIIRVPQDDAHSAANAICKLFQDGILWEKTADAAQKSASRFSDEVFESNLIALINNYDRLSNFTSYSPAEYQKAIRYMTYYSESQLPKFSFL